MREFDVLSEYTVFLDYESAEAILGHIHHIQRNPAGGRRQVPVAHFAARVEGGDDLLKAHWAVYLFLRSDVRYDPAAHETTVVANPKRQAGPDRSLLRRLRRLRDGGLAPYAPSLPRELGELLLRETACSKPAIVRIHHSTQQSYIAFGEIAHED